MHGGTSQAAVSKQQTTYTIIQRLPVKQVSHDEAFTKPFQGNIYHLYQPEINKNA